MAEPAREATAADALAALTLRWATVAGAILVLVGLVMVPLPGPRWLIASLGIVVLISAVAARCIHDRRARSQ